MIEFILSFIQIDSRNLMLAQNNTSTDEFDEFTDSMQEQIGRKILLDIASGQATKDNYAEVILLLDNYIKYHSSSKIRSVRDEANKLLDKVRATFEQIPTSDPHREDLLKQIAAFSTKMKQPTPSGETKEEKKTRTSTTKQNTPPSNNTVARKKIKPLRPAERLKQAALAKKKYNQQDFQGTIDAFTTLIESNQHCDDYMYRSLAYACKGNYDDTVKDGNLALKTLEKCTLSNLEKWTFYALFGFSNFKLAENLRQENNPDKTEIKRLEETAIVHINTSITLSPKNNNSAAYNYLARIYLMQENYPLTIHYCHEILKMVPDYPGIYDYLCEAYISLNELDKASNCLKKIPETDNNHAIFLAKINSKQRTPSSPFKNQTTRQTPSDDKQSFNDDKQILSPPKKLPESQRKATSAIGRTKHDDKKYQDAITVFTMLINFNQAAEDYMLRALSLAELKKDDAVIADGKSAIEAIKTKGERCTLAVNHQLDFYLTLGITHARKNTVADHLTAIEYLDNAALLEPSCSLAFINRGKSYLFLNEPEKAIDDFQKAIKIDQTAEFILKRIDEIKTLLEKNAAEQAARDLEQMQKAKRTTKVTNQNSSNPSNNQSPGLTNLPPNDDNTTTNSDDETNTPSLPSTLELVTEIVDGIDSLKEFLDYIKNNNRLTLPDSIYDRIAPITKKTQKLLDEDLSKYLYDDKEQKPHNYEVVKKDLRCLNNTLVDTEKLHNSIVQYKTKQAEQKHYESKHSTTKTNPKTTHSRKIPAQLSSATASSANHDQTPPSQPNTNAVANDNIPTGITTPSSSQTNAVNDQKSLGLAKKNNCPPGFSDNRHLMFSNSTTLSSSSCSTSSSSTSFLYSDELVSTLKAQLTATNASTLRASGSSINNSDEDLDLDEIILKARKFGLN